MVYYLQDTTLVSVALDLPMSDRGILASQRSGSTNPKDARTEQVLSRSMVENQSCFW